MLKPLAGILLTMCTATSMAAELANARIVDLSHAFNAETLYWPTSPSRFELHPLSHGQTELGYFYSANTFSAPEHGGTHLDAPIHFFDGGETVEQIPLTSLLGPAVVIDITSQTAANADYRLSVDDVIAFESVHGPIQPGTMVLLYSGWSTRWPDARRYLGDDTQGDASNLHFPSFGAEAAQLLVVGRRVTVLGVDTASIDYGQSRDFPVHRIAAEHHVIGLENLAHLDQLPPVGAEVIALPIKIEGGSGAPARVIARLPQ